MKKILVVDDQPEIRKLIRLTLNKRYAVIEASNADEAYERIVAEPPDAVLLDIMMPGVMDGLDLCKKLKYEEGFWQLPVILLTARGQQKDREEGVGAGADLYLIKPFSPLELVRRLETLLEDSP